jgi:AraC family transcriptional regulator of adaptative response/methylated-DNA-[protein]-cysteine methyltransferase
MLLMTDQYTIDYQRIACAIDYLQQNIHRQPELDEVADAVHLSPFHFQRLFTEWAGISPKRFLQYLTTHYLKQKLQETKNLEELAWQAGLSGQSRVYDLFTTLEAVTPQEYRQQGTGLQIGYGFHQTPFGQCLIGITKRGVCWLSFYSDENDQETELQKMREHWSRSIVHDNPSATAPVIQSIFYRQAAQEPVKLHALVKGTNFQVKVWEALLRIPAGAVTTYQHIAEQVDNPKALQAVGSAVGSNHIAYLIPCHRVIRKDGVLGEYRWESIRKKTMIGREMAAAEGFLPSS